MKLLLKNLLLAFTWIFLTGDITPLNFAEGFIVGFIILYLIRNLHDRTRYFSRIPKMFSLVFYFLWELLIANVKVAIEIMTPGQKMKPGIVAIPLDAESNLEITFLANMITLTPGTLSIDCSADKKVLYVHAMNIEDPEKFKMEIKNGFEKKLLEVTR